MAHNEETSTLSAATVPALFTIPKQAGSDRTPRPCRGTLWSQPSLDLAGLLRFRHDYQHAIVSALGCHYVGGQEDSIGDRSHDHCLRLKCGPWHSVPSMPKIVAHDQGEDELAAAPIVPFHVPLIFDFPDPRIVAHRHLQRCGNPWERALL